jgi:hypothetical protein
MGAGMTTLPPFRRVEIAHNAYRFELRLPALKVEASVERHSNGRWFWVGYVAGVPGKSVRSSSRPEVAKASAVRWIRAEMGRFEAEVEHARKYLQWLRALDEKKHDAQS